jgi:uncharacterized membrane protein (DUF4010 family)
MLAMQAGDVSQHFEPDAVAIKIALSVGIGLLVGFEREWSNKDIGVRSFALTALLGTLSALINVQLAWAAIATSLIIVVLVNWGSFRTQGQWEITTSIALMVTSVLGALVGLGHHFTPVAAAIIMTMLLAWKEELHRFAGGLRPQEIRSAVLLGLLGFVIYPALPTAFVDRWHLLNPRQAWVTIIVVALLGFANYVLLRVYSTKGLVYTAVLGGLVNSTATVSELAVSIGTQPSLTGMTVALILLTTIAMFVRNLLILAIFAPHALQSAAVPMLIMIGIALAGFFAYRRSTTIVTEEVKLGSPVSLRKVFTFGLLFLAIAAAGVLAQRFLGRYGVLLVSTFGGLVSSASTTAAAANMAHNDQISAHIAGLAAVLTSITSAMINVPIVSKLVPDRGVRNRLLGVSAVLAASGLLATWLVLQYHP